MLRQTKSSSPLQNPGSFSGIKKFYPVKSPDEPGDITGHPLLAHIHQNMQPIVITALFLNYSPGMLVALWVQCCLAQTTFGMQTEIH